MTKHTNELKPISYNKHPNVLILGNGICRAFGTSKWGDLLGEMSCTSYNDEEQYMINQMPFPLQAILMTQDNVDEGVDLIANRLYDDTLTNTEQRNIINSLLDIGFDAIITTNYTYEIEMAFDSDFKCEIKRNCKYRRESCKGDSLENQFGIYKYMHVGNEVKNNIWHMHGEIGRPKSMVLGHYYYGKLLVCIQKHIGDFLRRYNGMRKSGRFIPESWIDYFMLGNVYMIGLGLDQSEMDLWWLINCKKRHSKDLDFGEIIWFEPNMNSKSSFPKKALAEANNIKIVTQNIKNNGYKNYYKQLSKTITEYI